MKRRCVLCGEGFYPSVPRQRYCNDGHRQTGMERRKLLSAIAKNRFDPTTDDDGGSLHNRPGVYIVCLRHGVKPPPNCDEAVFPKFRGLRALYLGIASRNLRNRDYRDHFRRPDASRSTLRKSLGALFKYRQIPRANDTRKSEFLLEKEEELSGWMKQSLIIFFSSREEFEGKELTPDDFERELINWLDPPLNLNKNYGRMNKAFRAKLSTLRSRRQR